MKKYPPYSLTPAMVHAVSEISEMLGRCASLPGPMVPHLRRGNRIRSIHASLAIENNTLSLEQMTAVLEGKTVLGEPREIQEVLNAFAAYEAMERWQPHVLSDLLEAHQILMSGLVEGAGRFRSGGVGVFQGKNVVHMAPPAHRVSGQIQMLLDWLEHTDEHPLIAGSVFHYEFEFIHPFMDGNGRLGRLWQTLILGHWNPILAYLPVETVIRSRQDAYYASLSESDHAGGATPFILFMLAALKDALGEVLGSTPKSDQVNDRVSDQVEAVLKLLRSGPMKAAEMMATLGLRHAPTFRKNYLRPALDAGLIERTQPDAPNSPTQKYRLIPKNGHKKR